MSDLDKIIYTADKIEPTRVFKTKDLRKIAYKEKYLAAKAAKLVALQKRAEG